MDNDDVIDSLNGLIETCKDGEYGFRSCAENVRRSDLAQIFSARADECLQAAQTLQGLVGSLGGTPEHTGSTTGALHRGWVAIKGKLAGYSDLAVLQECERGEDVALAHYRSVLEKNLPVEVAAVVRAQYQGVVKNHGLVRLLRDEARLSAAA